MFKSSKNIKEIGQIIYSHDMTLLVDAFRSAPVQMWHCGEKSFKFFYFGQFDNQKLSFKIVRTK